MLDEAQYLINLKKTPTEQTRARDTLDVIHKGDVGRPVILLAAGLGMSKASFGELEISRFRGGCFVELGALEKDSERAVIQDWLVKEGGGPKGILLRGLIKLPKRRMAGPSIFRPMVMPRPSKFSMIMGK